MNQEQRETLNKWKEWQYKIVELNNFIFVYKYKYSDIFHACENSKWLSIIKNNKICSRCGKETPKNLLIVYKLIELKYKL